MKISEVQIRDPFVLPLQEDNTYCLNLGGLKPPPSGGSFSVFFAGGGKMVG